MTFKDLTSNSTFELFSLGAHGPVLQKKCDSSQDNELRKLFDVYQKFILDLENITFNINDESSSKQAIYLLTDKLNDYRNIALPILENRDNSGQENLRSTILEEFFQLLIFPLTKEIQKSFNESLVLGKANSYVGLTFTPKSFISLFEKPTPSIHTKDQDFVLGCNIQVSTEVKSNLGNSLPKTDVVIPVIAIECKTYIEKNMLDSCAGTAKRLKNAMPYCLYIVAAEYMKMEDAYPELTDIDEVFILTKEANSSRDKKKPPHPLQPDLIYDIFQICQRHLNKIWWSPEEALLRGRVINRP